MEFYLKMLTGCIPFSLEANRRLFQGGCYTAALFFVKNSIIFIVSERDLLFGVG